MTVHYSIINITAAAAPAPPADAVVDVLLFSTLNTGVEIGVSLDKWSVLKEHHDRVAAHPPLAAYLASDKRFPSPGTCAVMLLCCCICYK